MSIIVAIGTALAYGGLASISFAMDRHYADIHGRGKEPNSRTRQRHRMLGWSGIILSLVACIAASGWHTGPVLWCGVLTASAIVLTLLLQYAPKMAIRLGKMGYPAAIVAGVLSPLLR